MVHGIVLKAGEAGIEISCDVSGKASAWDGVRGIRLRPGIVIVLILGIIRGSRVHVISKARENDQHLQHSLRRYGSPVVAESALWPGGRLTITPWALGSRRETVGEFWS